MRVINVEDGIWGEPWAFSELLLSMWFCDSEIWCILLVDVIDKNHIYNVS